VKTATTAVVVATSLALRLPRKHIWTVPGTVVGAPNLLAPLQCSLSSRVPNGLWRYLRGHLCDCILLFRCHGATRCWVVESQRARGHCHMPEWLCMSRISHSRSTGCHPSLRILQRWRYDVLSHAGIVLLLLKHAHLALVASQVGMTLWFSLRPSDHYLLRTHVVRHSASPRPAL